MQITRKVHKATRPESLKGIERRDIGVMMIVDPSVGLEATSVAIRKLQE